MADLSSLRLKEGGDHFGKVVGVSSQAREAQDREAAVQVALLHMPVIIVGLSSVKMATIKRRRSYCHTFST